MKAPCKRTLILQDFLQCSIKFRMQINVAAPDGFVFPAPLLKYHRITAGLIRDLLFDLVRGQAGYIQTVYGSIGEVYPLIFLSHSHINSASSNSRRQDCSPDCYGNFSAGVLFFLFFRSFLFRIQKIQMFPLLFLLFFSLLLSAPLSAAAAIAFPLISCFHILPFPFIYHITWCHPAVSSAGWLLFLLSYSRLPESLCTPGHKGLLPWPAAD